jgi:aspartate aminotransferase
LGVGAYRDDEGKPVILECVKKAEKILLEKEKEKEYAFPDGYPSFRQRAIELAYGKDHPAL